ncbi:immunity 53 family protein [Pontibacter sp. 172403-2]|uniref:immunity 53 family protein n=1 Tax=Pontibacter rufus TaxID=2791028 RepID=UPI0018AFE046|nr:immunity 53 family protein [Pontibacter sp. 172403-2]MBF9255670.1 immunity 53 family protein [Pontibacter sp. 172403-2]
MTKFLLERIQDWYRNNCDGDWEHGFGIKITTVDNPGWSVEIELQDTALEKAEYSKQYDNGDDDWLFIGIKEGKFTGAGDPDKLNEILRIFLEEVLPSQADASYTYSIYVPVPNTKIPVWKEVTARAVNESVFEITQIDETALQNLKVLYIDDYQKIEMENLRELEYKIGDRVKCKLQTFFEGLGPAVTEKVE